MRVLFLGNKTRGVRCLDAVLERGDNVVGVVAPPDKKIEAWYPSLAEHARERGLPCIQPHNINSNDTREQLQSWNPELGVMAGYSQILDEDVLSIPTRGVINLHGGKIPEYRGASTLNWMIIEGEVEGGISILFADDGIDTGHLIAQETFEIAPEETINDIVDKTNKLFPTMLSEVLSDIEAGSVESTAQSQTDGAYYHSRRPQHGKIHWREMTAREVHDLVRALAGPYPSAFTFYNNQKIGIETTSLLMQNVHGVPGRVCLRRDSGVVVVAKDRGVLIEKVQPEGGDVQPANEFFETIGVDLS